ncbi:NAD(P)H-dependent oxidoreductase [Halobacillus fulvus]|nr:NAD(P)H-dependent oxidoreductase [Halobacillus fulvus]
MKIATIVGSIRKDSYNMKLAQYMQKRYENDVAFEIIPIHDLDHYDQDVEEDAPESIQAFKARLTDADAFLIVTPEFNHSIPGVLKNALDWLSRGEKEMEGKPTFIAGAATGALGTVRAQMHLRQILNAPGMGANVLPGNEILIGRVQHKIDEKGNLTDEATVEFIDGVIKQFIQFTQLQKERATL